MATGRQGVAQDTGIAPVRYTVPPQASGIVVWVVAAPGCGVCETATPDPVWPAPAPGSEAIPLPAPAEVPAESVCGGFPPPSGFPGAQVSPDGTHAKRTSYAVFGGSTRAADAADGSGSRPVAGPPAVWPTTATAGPEAVPVPAAGRP